MDVLSEVLKVVKLQGALFYNGEFSSPWSVTATSSRALARLVSPGAEHVIIYHLLTEGRAYIRMEDGTRISLNPGDIVMIPHGDRHIMENGPCKETIDDSEQAAAVLAMGLKLCRIGGGGELTKLVCGYMACEPRLSQVFLSGLPPVFKVSIRNDPSGRWLENSIRFSVDQAAAFRRVEKPCAQNYRKFCSWKHCAPTSVNFRQSKLVGSPGRGMRKLEKLWR